MKIYTKTGDQGETGLFGGPRVRKDSPRIEAYGTVDELNAMLGAARVDTAELDASLDELLARVQNDLFDLGAELATPQAEKHRRAISAAQITELEQAIDRYEERLPPLREFILPGGCPAAAQLHLARTVCRRAERLVVTLSAAPGESVSDHAIIYLNRLSDLLFVLARVANQLAGEADVAWQKRGE
jgi:cob(I)alamin adenosyltransferase